MRTIIDGVPEDARKNTRQNLEIRADFHNSFCALLHRIAQKELRAPVARARRAEVPRMTAGNAAGSVCR